MPYFDNNSIQTAMQLMFENTEFQDESELGPLVRC